MKTESELCRICPLKEVCDLNLIPEHAKGKRLLTNNPWNCRHISCPVGVDNAIKEIGIMKDNKDFFGFAYFQSPDKPSLRRVSLKSGIIESNQDGNWYSTGQSIHRDYIVDPQYFPFRRIRK